jgi:diacylglycerol kinase (ATP)
MLGIIINPKSGKKAFRRQRLYLWKLLKKRHQPFTYRVTKYAGHAIELARELVETGHDQILVLGGDGTVSETINGIMTANITEEQRSKVSFGMMPRGTGNDWGRYWGLTRKFKDALNAFFNGSQHPVDVGCLTYWRNNIEHHHYFINSIGFGIDPLTCRIATNLKNYIGSHHINYFFGLIIALFKIKPIPVDLHCDDQTIENKSLFTMNIGNGPYSGGGIKQNPDADPTDGIFHSMFLEPPTFKQICQAVPVLFSGGLTQLDFVHSLVGKKLTIDTKQHLALEADGIMMDIMGPCEVHCIHHAINMQVKI